MPTDSVLSLFTLVAPIAVGRGENPDDGSGVLLIVLSIVAVIVVIGTILTLIVRKTRG
jgi:hypothetical protein